MLRKGIVALMIGVMSVSSLQAADGKSSNSLLGLFRGPSNGHPQQRTAPTNPAPGGVKHAVVADADRQVPEIRQTSVQPGKPSLQPAESAPQPTPMQYAPPAPPVSPSSGPAFDNFIPPAAADLTVSAAANLPQSAPEEATYYGNEAPFQFASGPNSNFNGTAHQVSFPHHPYAVIGGLNQGMNGGHHLINGGYIPGNTGPSGGNGAGNLYPAPKPGIPPEVGVTAIVHEALHPHEMLYAHRYRAMYGPYYYRVHGGWIVTPFGVWSKENWQLQGTRVDVKYKSHISPFAMFHPPVIR